MNQIKAPNKYNTDKFTIFLAGSIDQGAAVDWQNYVVKHLSDLDVTILNPRRDNWDSSLEQTKDNPKFKEQVLWELTAMEAANLIVFVFARDSKSPITFYELGKFSEQMEVAVLVCAEEGFYRQGNLDIYCEYYNIPVYHSIDNILVDLRKIIDSDCRI
jgi:hypothetical protein